MPSKHKIKDSLRRVDAQSFGMNPDQYELRINDALAPACPYGNQRQYIGFDKLKNEYVRFTKSVFRNLIKSQKEPRRIL